MPRRESIIITIVIICVFIHFQIYQSSQFIETALVAFRDSDLSDENYVVNNDDDDSNQQNNNNDKSYLDHDCFKPYHTPIMGTHDLSRIINVGMPKCGSNSLYQYFHMGGFYSRHYHCGQGGYCGRCIYSQVKEKQPLLSNCGNFTVWTQMDFTNGGLCIFPQITLLDELYNENPNATFILPFRNVTGWIKSVTNWPPNHPNYRVRINNLCDFTEIGIERKSLMEDKNMAALYCNHVKHVRQFVHDHPSLTLIEFSIEDQNAGDILERYFGVNASYWGHVIPKKFLKKKMKTKINVE